MRKFNQDDLETNINVKLDIKAVKEDGTIEGYGSVHGNVDRGYDIVQKGAFVESLRVNKSIKMLWQHDPRVPIGVWDSVIEDEKGLYCKGRILLDVEKGKEAYALIKSGAIDGLSIGYHTIEHDWRIGFDWGNSSCILKLDKNSQKSEYQQSDQ